MKIFFARKLIEIILQKALPELIKLRGNKGDGFVEKVAQIDYQVKSLEPDIETVKLKIKKVEEEIAVVKASFQRFQDRQKLIKS